VAAVAVAVAASAPAPISSAGRVPVRRAAGALALLVLAVSLVPLAAPGEALVPGAAAGAPRWLLGVYGGGLGLDGTDYRTWLWVAFAAYLGVVVCAGALGGRAIGAAIVVAVIAFALAPPLHSLDVFSYISFARLGVLHGLNPYDFAPSAIPHDPAALRVDDFRDATTVYGPLFTLGSYPLALVGVPGALWAMKAISAGSVLGIAALVGRLAARRGLAPEPAAALVALNPLVLAHVVGGPHNDGLMMLALCLGVYLLLDGRVASGGAGIVAAVGIKAAAAFAAPFALLGSPSRGRLILGVAVGAALIGLVSLAAFGSSFLSGDLVGPASQSHTSYHSVPALLTRATGLGAGASKAIMVVLFAALVAYLLVRTARGGDWIRAAAWCGTGLLLASAYVTPWYVIWPLPLVAISRDRALILVTLAFCAYQLSAALPTS
jgi:alpha-1,6-mannosyltransferase